MSTFYLSNLDCCLTPYYLIRFGFRGAQHGMPNIKRLVDLERKKGLDSERERNRKRNRESALSAGFGDTNVKATNLDTNRHHGIGIPS